MTLTYKQAALAARDALSATATGLIEEARHLGRVPRWWEATERAQVLDQEAHWLWQAARDLSGLELREALRSHLGALESEAEALAKKLEHSDGRSVYRQAELSGRMQALEQMRDENYGKLPTSGTPSKGDSP